MKISYGSYKSNDLLPLPTIVMPSLCIEPLTKHSIAVPYLPFFDFRNHKLWFLNVLHFGKLCYCSWAILIFLQLSLKVLEKITDYKNSNEAANTWRLLALVAFIFIFCVMSGPLVESFSFPLPTPWSCPPPAFSCKTTPTRLLDIPPHPALWITHKYLTQEGTVLLTLWLAPLSLLFFWPSICVLFCRDGPTSSTYCIV